MARQKKTPEEVKSALKKEILALGIEKDPSRTVYQKLYHRGVAPSPNSALGITGQSWQELMKEFGFDYDVKKKHGDIARKYGKKRRGETNGPSLRKENERKMVIENALEVINNEKIFTASEFEKVCKEKLDLNYSTFKKNGLPFEKLIELYNKKYNKNISVRGKWKQIPTNKLVEMVVNYMQENNIKTLADYTKSVKGNPKMPSYTALGRRLKKNYSGVDEILRALLG